MKKTGMELAEGVAKEAAKKIQSERSFAMDLLTEFKETNKRMFIIILVLISVLVASNFYWLYTFTQFDFEYYEQDGNGYNNINTGEMGDIYNGAEIKEGNEEKTQ